MLTRIKGTQDILDLSLYTFLLKKMRERSAIYNFTEISTPILEKADLFKRTVGLETDIVTKEMYFVHSGHDEEDMVLRPEITASTVRAFLNAGIQKTPWKVFSCGPVFRHERPQKGRFREFNQLSLETIGSESPAADVRFITMIDRFCHEALKLDTYALVINFLGCPQDRIIYKNMLRDFVTKHESALCETCKARKEKNILRVLDCKNENCKKIYASAPLLTDHLCNACMNEWSLIKDLLHELSVSYTHSPLLVRGLDYYNKIVFEFVDMGTLGSQNAFCAGGRYDTIAGQLGGKKDYPSIGCAFGIERLVLMLDAIKDRLPLPQKPALHMVLPLDEKQVGLALQIADDLNAHRLCSDVMLEKSSLKNMLRDAGDAGATTCILVGSDEQAGGYVTVKNMIARTETRVPQNEIREFLQKIA